MPAQVRRQRHLYGRGLVWRQTERPRSGTSSGRQELDDIKEPNPRRRRSARSEANQPSQTKVAITSTQYAYTMRACTLCLALPSLAYGLAAPASTPPSCRFASDWTRDEVVKASDQFEWDLLYWEGQFHQNDVSYNSHNGMTYDGAQLDWVTGERTKKHPFSAASKEVQCFPCAIAQEMRTNRQLGPSNNGVCPCNRRIPQSCPVPVARRSTQGATNRRRHYGDETEDVPEIQRNVSWLWWIHSVDDDEFAGNRAHTGLGQSSPWS